MSRASVGCKGINPLKELKKVVKEHYKAHNEDDSDVTIIEVDPLDPKYNSIMSEDFDPSSQYTKEVYTYKEIMERFSMPKNILLSKEKS